jgi:hypothetical protein
VTASQILGASVSQKGGIVSNIPQFQEELQRYVKRRNATIYDSVLKKMQNVALKAMQYTEFSPPERISQSIANIPNRGPKTGNSQYVGQYKVINWERKIKGMQPLGGSKFRRVTLYKVRPGQIFVEEKEIKRRNKPKQFGPALSTGFFMDGKYKKFRQARIRGSKWLRIGWALAAKMLGVSDSKLSRGDFGPETMARLSGQAYGGGAEIKRVGAGTFEFSIFNGVGVFDHRYRPPGKVSSFTGKLPLRPSSQISQARTIQNRGLKMAVAEEIKDMASYVAKNARRDWYGK